MTVDKNIMTAERSAAEDNQRDHITALTCELERKDILLALARARIADQQAEITRLTAPPAYPFGCHCDLEDHMEPDGCVLDVGRPNDCTYARCGDKTICKYWLPMTPENRARGTF